MDKNDNDKFEKTSDFLELMTRSERKAWERAQQEDKDKVVVEALGSKEETSPEKKKKTRFSKHKEEKEQEEQLQNVNTSEIQVGEIGKTQQFLELTSEIATTIVNNTQENLFEEESSDFKTPKKVFNPITWIGLIIVCCFGYFLYIVLSSGYDQDIILLIDSAFLLGMVFLFSISILCNRTAMKVFSILNLLIALGFIGTNIYLLTDWEKHQKESNTNVPEEQILEETYECSLDSEYLLFKRENNYITYIEKSFPFTDEENLEQLKEIFKEQDGLTIKKEENQLLVSFDFSKLDINQYKVMIRSYLELYRESSDFAYVEDNKIIYTRYLDSIKDYTCTKKEG